MSARALIAEADALLRMPAAQLDLNAVVEFAKRSRGDGSLQPSDAAALKDRIDRLVAALADERDATADELSRLGGKRRAMKVYGHLKRNASAQRVYRRA